MRSVRTLVVVQSSSAWGCLSPLSQRGVSTNTTGEKGDEKEEESVEGWLKSFSRSDELNASSSAPSKLSPLAQAKYNYLVDRMPTEIKESVEEARQGISDSTAPNKLTSFQRKLVMERFSASATARMSSKIQDTIKEDPAGAQRLGVTAPHGDGEGGAAQRASNELDAAMTGDFSGIGGGDGEGDIGEDGNNSWHNAARILLDTSIPPFIRDEILEELVAARGKRGGGGGGGGGSLETQHDKTMYELMRQQEALVEDGYEGEEGDQKATHGNSSSAMDAVAPRPSNLLDSESHRNLKDTFSKRLINPQGRRGYTAFKDEDNFVLGHPGRLHEVGKSMRVANVKNVTDASAASSLAMMSLTGGGVNEEEEEFAQGIRWSGSGNIDAFMHPPNPTSILSKRTNDDESASNNAKGKEEERVIDFSDLKPLE